MEDECRVSLLAEDDGVIVVEHLTPIGIDSLSESASSTGSGSDPHGRTGWAGLLECYYKVAHLALFLRRG